MPPATLLRVLLPFALGHFMSYVLRLVNAVIAPDLARDVGVDATGLGFLTAAYFLAFAAFQLPLGVLLDRYGPRRTVSTLLLVAALGAVIFGSATSMGGLVAGRMLIGLGLSAGLMGSFKAIVLWFPKERWALLNGTVLSAGAIGALTATAPVEAALGLTDWRGVLFAMSAATTLASALIFLAVPRAQPGGGPPGGGPPGDGWAAQIRGIRTVYASPVFWRYTPPAAAAVSMLFATQSLWAGPWFRDMAGFDRDQVARGLFALAAAQIVGYPLAGALADRLRRMGVKTVTTSVSGMMLFAGVQVVMLSGISPWVTPVWIAFGFVVSTSSLSYAALCQNFPPELAGRVNTSANLIYFSCAFAAQAGMGAIIDLWPPGPAGGYATEGYQAAFGTMLAIQVLAIAWFFAAPRIWPASRGE